MGSNSRAAIAAVALALVAASPWVVSASERATGGGPEPWKTCADCHSAVVARWRGGVHARPAPRPAADCRDCHGPGEWHEARWREPAGGASGLGDTTILVPAQHDHHRRNALCVRCHSSDETRADWATGPADAYQFRVPPLSDSSIYDQIARPRGAGHIAEELMQSRCLLEARLTCLTCHDPHGGQHPAGLRLPPESDAPCLQCHAAQGVRLSAHTRHGPSSRGSRCVNCHMPQREGPAGGEGHGRLHTIELPLPQLTVTTGATNACLLCHMNQDVVWAARWRTRWWGSGDEHWRVRWVEALATAEIEPRASSRLLSGLLAERGQVAFVRASAAAALAAWTEREHPAELFEALGDESLLVRFHTLLGLLRSNALDGAEVTERAAADPHPFIQQYVADLHGNATALP